MVRAAKLHAKSDFAVADIERPYELCEGALVEAWSPAHREGKACPADMYRPEAQAADAGRIHVAPTIQEMFSQA